ncbi:MAG: LCP family protein [Clostridiales bacterium]|jgi:cell envelope-related transcriptional attenuator|nr:LCP family protein [Clostridiales bacterium]
MKDKRKNKSSEKEYDEIEVYVRDNENTKSTKKTKKKSKRDKKEDKKKNKKHTLRKVLLTLLLIIIVIGIIFFIHVQKNGGGLKGIVTTVIGSSAEKEKELQDIYLLVMGKSENMTDTIMVVKYSAKNQSASMLSIPRDTFTGDDEKRARASDKINSKYINGGAQDTLKEVNELTGLNIRYYLIVDTKALRDLVDAIGGVEFDVPIDMDYDDVTQALHIHVKKGLQLLNGEQAEGVVRFRHNNNYTSYPVSYGDNDLGRMRTQREFLKILLKQLMKPANITKINNLLKIAQEEVETNIDWNTAKGYVPSLFGFNTNNLVTNALPGEAKYANGVAVFIANPIKTKELINTMFLQVVNNTEQNEETTDTDTNTTKNSTKNEITTSSTTLKPKSSISLQLINGTGSKKRFEAAKTQLKAQGYKIQGEAQTTPIDKTIIINRKDLNTEDVEAVKSLLGTGKIAVGKTSEKNSITILIGKDY